MDAADAPDNHCWVCGRNHGVPIWSKEVRSLRKYGNDLLLGNTIVGIAPPEAEHGQRWKICQKGRSRALKQIASGVPVTLVGPTAPAQYGTHTNLAGGQALPQAAQPPQQPLGGNAVDAHDAGESPLSGWTSESEEEPQASQEDVDGGDGEEEGEGELLYGSEADDESEWEEDDDVDAVGADLGTHPQPAATAAEELPAGRGTAHQDHHTGSYKLNSGERKACQVCGLDLSVLNFLHQVQHVKQCMARRQVARSTSSRPAPPPTTAAAAAAPRVGVVGHLASSGVLQLDIREWLKGLQLEQYQEVFVAEEIDMTIVHALTDSDLRSLGVTDRLHQRRILDAAKQVGARIAAAKRARRGALGPAKLKQQVLKPLPPPPPQKQQQATSSIPNIFHRQGAAAAAPSSSRAVYRGDPSAPHSTAGTSAPSKVRNAEQGLLETLYPEDPGAEPLPTPPLAPAAALASSRAAPGASLWASAARCQQVTDALEVRLEKRKATRPPGETEEELCRGGVKYTRADESRALKTMKLEALKEELKTHEATVLELRQLVAELEAELGE